MSVQVERVSFSYGGHTVLRNVSFSLSGGQLVSLLGPNGVGKSTLFKCMLGLLRDYTGVISVQGQDIRRLARRAMAQQVAYISQSHHPAFHYSVLDMVLMGTSPRLSPLEAPNARERNIAMDALARMGLADYARRDFMRISGGEQQLVLIARALAQQSRVLIMDEPTANLDYGNQIRVLERMRALADSGYTILQSTHNPDQAALFSHHILAMHEGRLIAQGMPAEVMDDALMQALYGLDIRVRSLPGSRMRVCVPAQCFDTPAKRPESSV